MTKGPGGGTLYMAVEVSGEDVSRARIAWPVSVSVVTLRLGGSGSDVTLMGPPFCCVILRFRLCEAADGAEV